MTSALCSAPFGGDLAPRHWVTGSEIVVPRSPPAASATMTSAMAGKRPLQARHMLLARPAAAQATHHYSLPSSCRNRATKNNQRVNNVWAAPETRQHFLFFRGSLCFFKDIRRYRLIGFNCKRF
ncbi:uncharacterized protein Dana_GF26992 [Drosophila ananassae]|uniref:Uncharacterized protein n=1 Tax=Drosophila ananassae TaxID=7217 RepID=A0A0P9AI04_DROAN|nr:uncharacterized protein Dana_GF26992 [Drosophila ananassae]